MQEKIKTRWVWNEKLQERQMVEYGTGKYSFTEEDKISIVSEYVCGHVPASVIVEKYHIGTRQTLFNWMDKYVNEKELVSLPAESENSEAMAKKTPEERLGSKGLSIVVIMQSFITIIYLLLNSSIQ